MRLQCHTQQQVRIDLVAGANALNSCAAPRRHTTNHKNHSQDTKGFQQPFICFQGEEDTKLQWIMMSPAGPTITHLRDKIKHANLAGVNNTFEYDSLNPCRGKEEQFLL